MHDHRVTFVHRDAVMQLTEAASTTVSPHRSGQADPGNISYGYTLVASENAKDIPFIISIPGAVGYRAAVLEPCSSLFYFSVFSKADA